MYAKYPGLARGYPEGSFRTRSGGQYGTGQGGYMPVAGAGPNAYDAYAMERGYPTESAYPMGSYRMEHLRQRANFPNEMGRSGEFPRHPQPPRNLPQRQQGQQSQLRSARGSGRRGGRGGGAVGGIGQGVQANQNTGNVGGKRPKLDGGNVSTRGKGNAKVSGLVKQAKALSVQSSNQEPARKVPIKNMNDEKIKSLKNDGLILKSAPDIFWCVFCDQNVTSLKSADEHIASETHKNIRKEGFKGLSQLDRIFLINSPRMLDATIAQARRDALDTVFGSQKLELVNQGIRLKDGMGAEAFWCEPCQIHLPSVSIVTEHVKNRRHTTNAAEKVTSVTLEEEDSSKQLSARSLEDRLKVNTKPIIGLESITEFVDPDGIVQRVYKCKLCNSFDVENSILSHLTGYEHRLNYIKSIDESEAEKYKSKNKETEKLIEEKASQLESESGCGKWETLMEKSSIMEDATKQPISLPAPPQTGGNKAPQSKAAPTTTPTMPVSSLLEHLDHFSIETDTQLDEVARIIAKLTDSIMNYKIQSVDPKVRQFIVTKHLIGPSYGRILTRVDRIISEQLASHIPEETEEQEQEQAQSEGMEAEDTKAEPTQVEMDDESTQELVAGEGETVANGSHEAAELVTEGVNEGRLVDLDDEEMKPDEPKAAEETA